MNINNKSNACSDRKSVNGWTSWKTASGKTIDDLIEQFLDIISTGSKVNRKTE